MKTLFMSYGAGISTDGLYRYWLSRIWDASLPTVCWIMLNPSTADAEQDDPTIRRCIGFSDQWGFGGLYVVNLFAYRATNPNDLHDTPDPVGPENDLTIIGRVKDCHRTVAAWGVKGTFLDRERKVMGMLAGLKVECLGTTKSGRPRHPLYVSGDTQLETFEGNR